MRWRPQSVRKAAGISFPRSDTTTSNLIAEATLAEDPPEWGTRRDALGTHSLDRVEYEIRDGEVVYADCYGNCSLPVATTFACLPVSR
jgi:hypothetical protein